jgi:dTDP-4-dehydrorhamnose 3,5-epimerase-like enzyme
MNAVKCLNGGSHKDQRGVISFVNDFDMAQVKRFYQIKHDTVDVFRAWQGHQKESKWFYCIEGSFTINWIKPTSWTKPSGLEQIDSLTLNSHEPQVLYVPKGYITGIKANLCPSRLMVYSDFTLSESQLDDFRFDFNLWTFKI